MAKLECNIGHAPLFTQWIQTRGGLARWQSINLSNPGASWTTPALTEDGLPYPKPNWQAADKPEIITDPQDVMVYVPREIRRFRVAVRRGDGLSFKCTAASSRRIRDAVEAAGTEAYYEFDYTTQEAVIFACTETTPLADWMKQNPA